MKKRKVRRRPLTKNHIQFLLSSHSPETLASGTTISQRRGYERGNQVTYDALEKRGLIRTTPSGHLEVTPLGARVKRMLGK